MQQGGALHNWNWTDGHCPYFDDAAFSLALWHPNCLGKKVVLRATADVMQEVDRFVHELSEVAMK